MLDKLRVCIICSYYSNNGRLNLNEYINHPAIRQLKCEHLNDTILNYSIVNNKNLANRINSESALNKTIKHDTETESNGKMLKEATATSNSEEINKADLSLITTNEAKRQLQQQQQFQYQMQYQQQFNIKVCVGNVSKYLNYDKLAGVSSSSFNNTISSQKANQQLLMMNNNDETTKANIESSQYNQDLITHKWMIYIRSSNCNKIENYIKKVIFYLHFSYKPYDVVEVK